MTPAPRDQRGLFTAPDFGRRAQALAPKRKRGQAAVHPRLHVGLVWVYESSGLTSRCESYGSGNTNSFGHRQGERLVLDGRELRVGCDRNCEVFFDAARDPAIQGRSAVLHLRDDGWYLHPTGGQVWVNQQPVARSTRLRSGDIVRMSERGPDFSFGIVAASAPWWTGPVATAHRAGMPSGVTPMAGAARPGSAVGANPAAEPNAAIASAQGAPGDAETAPSFGRPSPVAPPTIDRRWAIGAAAVVVLGLLVFGISKLGSPPPPAAPPNIVINLPPTGPAVPPPPGRSTDPGLGRAGTEKPETTPPGPAEPPPKDPDAELRAKLDGTVYLIEVEKPVGASSKFWPFATCVAVGDNVLLTTAREAAILDKMRQEQHFKIWVTRQSTGFKEEVDNIRVAKEYAALPETTDDWIYVNLGLLTVRKSLPQAMTLASPEELVRVKRRSRCGLFRFYP